jgi:hypothetical protein
MVKGPRLLIEIRTIVTFFLNPGKHSDEKDASLRSKRSVSIITMDSSKHSAFV